MPAPDRLSALEQRLGHRFGSRALLREALTHSSSLADQPAAVVSNQRLEFLGDAVLHLVLTHQLFQDYPAEREGGLSRRRAALSNGAYLAGLARDLRLQEALRLGASEESAGGRGRDSILGDALEAVIGAIYLDGGLEATRRVVLGWYGPLPARLAPLEDDDNPKGRLQELIQPRLGNHALRYEVVATRGPSHQSEFEVEVFLVDRALGRGCGRSKRLAEEAAARAGLATLRADAARRAP